MVSLLVKFFTRNKVTEAEKRSVTGKVCGLFGIFLNVILFAVKFICGLLSGSISITADAINNLTDAGSSVITLVGFRMAEKKPDPHHPFGHGRMEYISGLTVSALILLMGFELLKTSVTGLIEPSLPDFGALTVIILSIGIAGKLYICLYNRKFGKKIASGAMLATSADSLGDVLSTTAVLVASIVAYFSGFVYLDAICGIAVSLFILFSGIRSVKETVSPLLGQPPSKEFVKRVEEIALSEPLVIGIHDMLVHDYGPGRVIVSLHCEVSSEENVIILHEAIDGVESRIMQEMNCIATIHMDPVDLGDEVLTELHKVLPDIVKGIDRGASYHDLRVVRASGHINVIFDVLLPAGSMVDTERAYEMLKNEIKKTLPLCECIVRFETDFAGATQMEADE